jgi:hypothetical protein
MKRFLLTLFVLFLVVGWVEADYLERGCLYQRDDSYITSVYSGDLDGDGIYEVFAGTDNGMVMNLVYRDCRLRWGPTWQYLQGVSNKGIIKDMKISDLENDGENELVVVADSGNEYLLVLGKNGLLKWTDEMAGGFALSIEVADIDDDNNAEIILGGEGKGVIALNGENDVKWKTELDNPVYFVKVADVDNDGNPDIVALTNNYGISATVYVLDRDGNVVWNHSIEEGIYQASMNSIFMEDIDDDNDLEILVATYKKGLIVLDHDGNEVWDYKTDRLVTSVLVSELNDDDEQEIIFGSNPYLYILDKNGDLKSKIDINDSARTILVSDLENDGVKEIIIGTNNLVRVIGGDGKKKGEWSFGRGINAVSIRAADLDNDDKEEIIAGYGWDEGRLEQRYKYGELIVLEVTPYVEVTTTSTMVTTTTLDTTTTTVVWATSTTIGPEEGGGMSALLIMGVVVVIFAVSAVIVAGFFLMIKRGKGKSKEEPGVKEAVVEKPERKKRVAKKREGKSKKK